MIKKCSETIRQFVCPNPHYAKDLCRTHYYQKRYRAEGNKRLATIPHNPDGSKTLLKGDTSMTDFEFKTCAPECTTSGCPFIGK